MRLVIMQPYLFPYLGYFQLMAAADKFIAYDDVAFINRGWVNRNRILVNGEAFMFTLPLKQASQNKLINQIEVDNLAGWREKFLKTLQQNYRKAPHAAQIIELTSVILNPNQTMLSQVLMRGLEEIRNYLGLSAILESSTQRYHNHELKAQERIVDICKQEQAQVYINAIGGIELYEKQRFEKEGITLKFQKSNLPVYPQGGAEFVPALSILDVLMYNSLEEVQGMLNDFVFI